MSRSQDEMDDLKDMQLEAEKLRKKRERAGAKGKPESGDQAETEPVSEEASSPEVEVDQEAESPEPDLENSGVAVHVESVLRELEILAKNHPALALATAFSIGLMAGNLFSRR